MKGERKIYNDLQDGETILSFYKRHRNKQEYGNESTAFNHLKDFCEEERYEVLNIDDPEAVVFAKYMK